MTIRDRLIDAKLLWDNGRVAGAWIQVLIAAAGTSRSRYPNKKDGEAFRAFIKEVALTIMDGRDAVASPGITVMLIADSPHEISLDEVLYKQLRCTLLHEGKMPEEVLFSEPRMVDGTSMSTFINWSPLTLPGNWVINLAKAVAHAPENFATCGDLVS